MNFSAAIRGEEETVWLDSWREGDFITVTQGQQQLRLNREQLRELAETALAELDYQDSGDQDAQFQRALEEIEALNLADAEWAAERGLECGCITCQLDWKEAHPKPEGED